MADPPASVFQRLTNGVYVIGVAHGGRVNAFTAAWLTQVSFQPLMLALSINSDHASYPLLTQSRVFTVNVLGREQLELARTFGTRSGRETDKLEGVRWRPGRLGPPVLLDAVASLECRMAGSLSAGDHELIVARVVGGAVLDPAATPMAYAETGNLDGSAELFPADFAD